MNKCKTCCHCKSEDGNHIKRKDRSEDGSFLEDVGTLALGVGLGLATFGMFNDDDYDDGYNDDYDY